MCGPHNNNSGYPEVYVQKMMSENQKHLCYSCPSSNHCKFTEEVNIKYGNGFDHKKTIKIGVFSCDFHTEKPEEKLKEVYCETCDNFKGLHRTCINEWMASISCTYCPDFKEKLKEISPCLECEYMNNNCPLCDPDKHENFKPKESNMTTAYETLCDNGKNCPNCDIDDCVCRSNEKVLTCEDCWKNRGIGKRCWERDYTNIDDKVGDCEDFQDKTDPTCEDCKGNVKCGYSPRPSDPKNCNGFKQKTEKKEEKHMVKKCKFFYDKKHCQKCDTIMNRNDCLDYEDCMKAHESKEDSEHYKSKYKPCDSNTDCIHLSDNCMSVNHNRAYFTNTCPDYKKEEKWVCPLEYEFEGKFYCQVLDNLPNDEKCGEHGFRCWIGISNTEHYLEHKEEIEK